MADTVEPAAAVPPDAVPPDAVLPDAVLPAAVLPAAVLHGADGHQRPFRVHRQEPSPGAADVAHHVWAVEWDLGAAGSHQQEVLTYPCHHLTVEPDGCWVHGVVTRRFARTLSGRGRAVGAHLRAAGLATLTGWPDLSGTTDQQLPMTDLLPGPAADTIRDASTAAAAATALDEWLTTLPRHEVPAGPLVEEAVWLAQSERAITRVEHLAVRLAVSPRTLQRHLGRVLGVSPKWLVQRARIHDALTSTRDDHAPDWADLAQRLGFADQAHFTNTFTAIVGVPPARYVTRAGSAEPTPPAAPPLPSRL